ncbi:DUF3179 domain-containing protein [Loktanella sp. IMCC34160]|uniref:DUF3179 domain-containing protein n=1 Tax=Loktanella sp. IMCC34160 TaxID=2510646 RepID=UPI00101CA032|nr:DUF3179 domain-containing protein [Loktanella sp. IMCC34160]RYG91950.1 DUF3179 domain-containing protein [Loktanella sp. IMCC34160]
MRLPLLSLVLTFVAGLTTAEPQFWRHEWPNTDFTTTTVESWTEVLSGGPPKDGIPAIDDPSFHPVAEETVLAPREPVIAVELPGEVPRAYPIRYLMWHEIVNDRIGDTPVTVTFCPLCNSGLTFDRRVGGQELSFGVSGKLRNSDMIMYDRQTESWWQQAVGRGIVGEMTGTELQSLPSWMEAWEVFAARNPDALVMSEPTEVARSYGENPYVRYDSAFRPFLFNGEMPPHDISPLARVVRVGDAAWPLTRLAEAGRITERGVTLTWVAGQASALDGRDIGDSRDVGNVRVRDGAGDDVVHDVMFAFAFHAFWPEGEWMLGQ